ncbi:solute carrier family 35 member F6-like [Limulus polyphemus]|uniref:Solute carrier family 35 member F6-like n=1 Tax=Limulus polyphemus TaxID=6850 RepID=A0ABM1B6F0_LIMPO|nr:solute carrier family 35 member F6-like [Limulus polyphemus]
MVLTLPQILLCVGMLVTGSINTLSKKAQNDCYSPGYPDSRFNNTVKDHKFDHPWFQTIIMFTGEMACLIGLCHVRWKERKMHLLQERNRLMVSPGTSDGLSSRIINPSQPRVFQWIFVLPTVCDLIGTSLAGIGLLYVDASVWQMLRGSIIIFTGISSKIFLKRKLHGLQWTGIIVTTVGLVLVGLSDVLEEHHSSDSRVVLGIILILAGQLANAIQMIIEEVFLKGRGYHPLQVVGMEGTFGFVIMAVAVLPVMYFIPGPQVGGSYENSLDAVYQIGQDYRLLLFSLLYLSSIAFYNYFGLAVTKSLTAVHRTLIDACRTILVWACGLIVYYFIDKSFGEPFDKQYGIIQVDGFFFLMIGTAFYNELMEIPFIPWLRRPISETYPSLVDADSPSYEGSINSEVEVNERSSLLPAVSSSPAYS